MLSFPQCHFLPCPFPGAEQRARGAGGADPQVIGFLGPGVSVDAFLHFPVAKLSPDPTR